MKSILVAGVILMPLAMMGSAVAGPCDGSVTDVGGVLYIDYRAGIPPGSTGNGVWIYLESNGQAGLQRGGQSVILGAADPEICFESATPDTLIL